ncbi:hypothetical protein [Actinoplanes sp. ATCC 53533]|uniref:hypothetical protein n=1 Tax=Actinoplanes sp. ATCC 53533 TaxID=1288362 RepID=UPI000F77A01A|nr:hypothetical protein [Actinoplanes sp. ATCC 53533]
MQPLPARHQFSYGFGSSRSTRLTFLTLGGLLGVVAAGCLGGILGFAIASVVEAGTGKGDSDLIVIPVIVVLLLTGGVLTWLVVNILAVVKMGAWLDGTRLTVRQRRSRTVDLAGARSVALQPTRLAWKAAPAGVATAGSERIPEVVVTGPEGTVRMRLCDGERTPLPPQDLHVLAGVLSVAPAAGAAEVAKHLRMMATGRAPG